MFSKRLSNKWTAGAAFAAIAAAGLLISTQPGHAANDNNGAQDQKQMIQIGLAVAPVQLTMQGKDPDSVGLGSYIVNVVSECNGCHSIPSTAYTPTGNPYLRTPPFSGVKQINITQYLGGKRDFGDVSGSGYHIISRNLTPDKSGRAAGGMTLAEFEMAFRHGFDDDHLHPNCNGSNGPNCLNAPFNGDVLQIMPWPAYQRMTDRQVTAIYDYLSSIPCIEGGPGEPPIGQRCQ